MDDQDGGHTHKLKEKELIETIKKVSLGKDDILILQVDGITLQEQGRLCCTLDSALPEQAKYLILPKDIDINVLSLTDLNKGEMN